MVEKRRAHYIQLGNTKLFCLEENAENWELNHEHKLSIKDISIDTGCILGRGHFGIVFKGKVKEEDAAFKKLRKHNGITDELKILCHLEFHPNVVKFLGIYGDKIGNAAFYIATELCSNGSLKRFLRRLRGSTSLSAFESQLLLNRFCLEIASGMQHIADKQIVHRDLATRNVLLDRNLVCKISDFGLSYQENELQENAPKTRPISLPWRWMAYESLNEMEFSSMSDMWSYGVTLWEIFTLGNLPYSGTNWSPDFVKELKNGLRLPAPIFATVTTYENMRLCWSLNTTERPNFSDMTALFSDLCGCNNT